MDFMVDVEIKKPAEQISYKDKILLTGSCFTEHIGNALQELKFSVLQNPNGILFDPVSVCKSLISYVDHRKYTDEDIFQLNEVWHSWQHHSRFSNIDKVQGLHAINQSQQQAHEFLKHADWIIVTLGSAFSYRLSNDFFKDSREISLPGENSDHSVANCHRAPAQWFNKHLLEIDTIISQLDNCYHRLLRFNPKIKLIFTVSPVRHIRDGVIDNNRSKARLIEAVHHMVNKFDRLYYFPAYELVVDVLRDYRFYDADLVHPNYMATEFVLEKFSETFIDDEARQIMQEVKKIVIARKHKPFQPDTKAHQQFLKNHFDKSKTLKEKYPFLELTDELLYFSQA